MINRLAFSSRFPEFSFVTRVRFLDNSASSLNPQAPILKPYLGSVRRDDQMKKPVRRDEMMFFVVRPANTS